jgi:hypothetical protein
MAKFYRDQADQSRVSHVNLMADWIAAYGKSLMPRESAQYTVVAKANFIKHWR